MASKIEEFLNKILSSRYGKDVRQAIHDGIHQCYEDGKAGSTDLVAREQIANLVANNNPTDGNSELVDIRLGADGRTYKSAGEAVRKQVDFLNKLQKIDFAWKNGFYTSINGVVPHESYKWSGYIDISKNKIPIYYYLHQFKNTVILFFDSNKNVTKYINTSLSDSLEYVEGTISPSDYENNFYVAFCTTLDDDNSVLSYTDIGNASMATDLADQSVTSEKLADQSVTSEKLADQSVTSEKTTFIVHDDNSNFINEWDDNCYIRDGILVKYEGFYTTKPILLGEGTYYYGGDIYRGYYAFYDKNMDVIESHNINDPPPNPFTTPSETVYARFVVTKEENKKTAWISKTNIRPEPYTYMLDKDIDVYINIDNLNIDNPCDYIGDDICAFTNCLCVGDSLTAGTMNRRDTGVDTYVSYEKYSYPANLERMTGITVVNKGISGATSGEWYEQEKNNDLSGYDIAIIQLGVNDAIRAENKNMDLDEWFDDSSLCGFSNIVTKLKNENKNIKIFVANIPPAKSYSSERYLNMSSYLSKWVTDTYVGDKNVILLDLQQYGHTLDLDAYNCGHLSAYGYNRLARDYKGYIGWYMHQKPNVFKEIQFIGTDYWYDNPNS